MDLILMVGHGDVQSVVSSLWMMMFIMEIRFKGWITDNGEVKSVTVNDDGKFAFGKEYRADAEVVITYHAWGL